MVPKYPKTPHWPQSAAPHKEHRYHKNPDMFVGVEVVATEKLDGGNTSLREGKTYSRSTGQPATEPWFDYVKAQHAPRTLMDPDQAIYGENMYAVHSIQYGPLPDFYHVFHVLHVPTMTFFAWDVTVAIAAQYGFMHVPVLFRGKFDSVRQITEFMRDMTAQPSVYGPDREGVVLRIANEFPYSSFDENVAKYVRKNHVKTDVHWTKTWYPATLQRG